jgi:hypothetical protein
VIRGTPRNWTLQESRAVMNRYLARLRPVDKLYERIFEMMRRRAARLEREANETIAIPMRV